MANAGDAIGWMWHATRIATGSRPTPRGPISGAIATTSSKLSMTTSHTTVSCANKSPVTNSIQAIRGEMAQIIEPLRVAKAKGGSNTFEDEVQEAIFMEASKRDPWQQMMYHTAKPRVAFDEEPDARTLRGLKGDNGKRYTELKKQLSEFDSLRPKPLPEGQFMIDISATAPQTYVLQRGDWRSKGEQVQPGFLSILDPGDTKITKPEGLNSTGRRSALAAWLTDAKNPLTARVMVNRVWQYHFGTGIAATSGDFGRMGSRPA